MEHVPRDITADSQGDQEVRERRVKVLAFKTTETKEKVKALIILWKKTKNPLAEDRRDGCKGAV